MVDPKTASVRPPEPSGARVGEKGWASLLCFVCLVVLFSNLGGGDLFEPDEGRNAEKAREILLLDDWVTPRQNFFPTLDKPIAYYWLVALSFKLFGLSEWSARLPSVLAACGCVLLVYRFARRQWGVWEALWSCLVLLTSVEFFVLSRIVIFDMTLSFFLTWALISFYTTVHTDKPQSVKLAGLLMYVAMGAGTLVKGPIALVIPGLVIFGYFLFTHRWSLLRRMNLGLGALVYLAVVAPWYLWAEARNSGYLRYFFLDEHFVRFLTPRFGRSQSWYYFFIVLAVGFIPWSVLIPHAVRSLYKRTFDEAGLFAALWVIFPLAFFSASNSQLPHYILPIYPAVALLAGRVLAVEIAGASARQPWVVYLPWLLALGSILYLLIGAAAPNLLPPQIRAAVTQQLYLIVPYGVIVFLVFGALVFGNLRCFWQDQGAAYLCTAIGLALFWVLVGRIMSVASFHRISKALAAEWGPLMRPEDRVVFYDTYIEGIPFYLRIDKPIWLVQASTKDEAMGSYYVGQHHPAPPPGQGQILFSFEEFADQWKKNQTPLKVFLKEKNFPKLKSEVGSARPIAQLNEYLLVTNR